MAEPGIATYTPPIPGESTEVLPHVILSKRSASKNLALSPRTISVPSRTISVSSRTVSVPSRTASVLVFQGPAV